MLHSLVEAFDAAVNGVGVAGVSVVEGADTTAQSHWFPAGVREPAFLAYSITKTFHATCVLLLADAARLSLDDRLARWFPAIDRAQRISLRQLLNHRSGIPDYGALPQYHEAVRASPREPWGFERYASETFDRGLAFEPGTSFRYSNPGYMLLRNIVENVSGCSYRELLKERIFRPLELTRSFVPETLDDLRDLAPAPSTSLATDGSVRDTRLHYHPGWVAHGVVASTPSEIARFFAALFAGRVLSPASLAAMTELVPVPAHLAPGTRGQPSYGLGLMGDPTTPHGPSWGHAGGGPGYQAAVQHLAGPGATACVMAGIETGFDATALASEILEHASRQIPLTQRP